MGLSAQREFIVIRGDILRANWMIWVNIMGLKCQEPLHTIQRGMGFVSVSTEPCTVCYQLKVRTRELWPMYLSSLTAVYNSTPHAVTGFLPHYILFGVEPHLPMDGFAIGSEEAATTHHEWVRRLQETHRVAWGAAKRNRRIRQEQAKVETLNPGQKVLLRDHSVLGINPLLLLYLSLNLIPTFFL